jgi:hypothetical protein
MKNQANLLLVLCVVALCWADEPSPYFREFARLDHIFALTGTPSQTGATALELLELVALGRTSAIRAGSETQIGLFPGEFQYATYAEPSVRVYALQKIGECRLPEALEFLQNLKRSDLGEDTTQMIWPNSRVALTNALLNRIENREARTEFLVNTLKEGRRGLVVHWASQQLCDQGTSTALPLIGRAIRNNWPGPHGEEELAFCESRIKVIARDPDRVKALGSVLAVDNEVMSDRLIRWAVAQLDSMHTPRADAELDRFAIELGKLREGSPEYQRFGLVRAELYDVRARRPK